MLSVLWPDKTEEIVRVQMKEVMERVYDHGHEYPVKSKIPYITLDYHGKKTPMPLHEAGCKVWLEE